MLDFQIIPIPLAGLAQKQSALTKAPGALERAINVVVDKQGRLSKRRGYQFVDPADVVNRVTTSDQVFIHLATRFDELLVFGYNSVLALGDKDSLLGQAATPAALIYRGPCNRGNAKLHYVSTSRTSVQDTLAP